MTPQETAVIDAALAWAACPEGADRITVRRLDMNLGAAVELLRQSRKPLTVGNSILVAYQGHWYSGTIIEDQDPCWRVQLPNFVVTVWKGNTSSWKRG